MKNKKAFTVVELVIVIAIIAILAAVLIPTFSSLIKKANVSKDQQLIRNLNTALATSQAERNNKPHANMTEALEAAEKFGYEVGKINASGTDNEILWDSKNDVFCYYDAAKGTVEYIPESVISNDKPASSGSPEYWCIITEKNVGVAFSGTGNEATLSCGRGNETIPKNWSCYLATVKDGVTAITTATGVDVGETTALSTINYVNASTQTVVIRTNSATTELIINAVSDTVRHYDQVGTVHIIAIDSHNCYEENGKAAFTQIDSGKYKTTETAEVELLFVSASGVEVEVAPGTVRHAHAISEQVANTLNNSHPGVTFDYDGNIDQSTLNDVYHHVQAGDQIGFSTNYNTNKDLKAVTEAVNNAVDDEKFDKAIVATKGSNIIECSIAEFRDRVNGLNGFEPESFEGYVVTLVCNVDLKNEEWIPIGTQEHPFSGVFDGGNHTVRNMKITEYTASKGVGLFGNLVGDENMPTEYTTITQVWNNNEFILDFFAATNYSARVSNINVSNFEINSTKDFNGVVVGYAKYAYVSNATVSNGTITATGKVGGVIGSTGRDMVAKDLTTSSNVTIIGTGHTVGGIIAGFNRDDEPTNSTRLHAAAAINCINNANIINNTTGIVGGIVGNLGNTRGLCGFVYNCINNGNISLNNNGSNKLAGGILGDGKNAKIVVNCINNGNINIVSTNAGWYVAGISADTAANGTVFYNCVNNGDINAYATRLAGITALENTGSEINPNCENNGLLMTTNPNGAVYQLTGGHYSKQTYTASSTPISGIAGVNEKIDDNYSIYEFTGYGEIDGELVINNTYVTITSDSRICSTVSIQNSTTQTVVLDIPGISCTISGNMSNLTLVLKGAGSHVTIASEAKIGKLQIEGTNSIATINGYVKNLILAGDSNPSAEITSTGKCERVSFSGTGSYTLTNRGLISSTCNDQWGTTHVVTTQSACTIIINNYGIIESKTGEYNRCAYALLFYNGCDVTFNAYNGSRLTCEAKGLIMACWSSNSVTINYQAGAELIDGGTSRLYSSITDSKVTVSVME